jgi:hypothetical protein
MSFGLDQELRGGKPILDEVVLIPAVYNQRTIPAPENTPISSDQGCVGVSYVNRSGNDIIILLRLTTPRPLLQGHKSQQRIRGRRICFSVPRVHGHIETSDVLMNGDGLFGHPLYPTVKSRYRRYEDAGKNPPTLPCSARIRHHKSIINAEPAVRCTSTSCRSNLQPSPRS